MKNPFHAQGPSNPKYYANRNELLAVFKGSVMDVKESGGVTRPLNLSIMGQWGIGKTSTLYKLKDILANECASAKVFSSIIPLKPACCTDADTFSAFILETMFSDYSVTAKLPDKLKGFISQELRVLENWRLSKVSIKPEFERKQQILKAVNFKDALSRFWKKLAACNFDLAVIMIDDIHYVLDNHPEFLYDLRTDMQSLSAEGARYSIIITGPASLYPEMRDKAEPFTRLFEKLKLEPFDLKGTRELIYKPLQTEGINLALSEEVVKHIQEITGGHPFFITLMMRDLLMKKQSGKVSDKEFAGIYPDLMTHFSSIKFDDDYNKATEAEKKVLHKMASYPKELLSPLEAGGRGTATLLERLVKKDLVAKEGRGKYKLYNNLFKAYLRKKAA